MTPAPITPAAPPPITPAAPAAPVPPVTLSQRAAPARLRRARLPRRSPELPPRPRPDGLHEAADLALMPGGTGALCPRCTRRRYYLRALLLRASNPGLPTVLVLAGAQRARQVALLDGLRQSGGVAPLFARLRTRRGRLRAPGSSCKAFRFAGYCRLRERTTRRSSWAEKGGRRP